MFPTLLVFGAVLFFAGCKSTSSGGGGGAGNQNQNQNQNKNQNQNQNQNQGNPPPTQVAGVRPASPTEILAAQNRALMSQLAKLQSAQALAHENPGAKPKPLQREEEAPAAVELTWFERLNRKLTEFGNWSPSSGVKQDALLDELRGILQEKGRPLTDEEFALVNKAFERAVDRNPDGGQLVDIGRLIEGLDPEKLTENSTTDEEEDPIIPEEGRDLRYIEPDIDENLVSTPIGSSGHAQPI